MPETDGTWTVRRLLEWTTPFLARKGLDSPRLAAEMLLAHVLAVPRIRLYTDYERVLPEKLLASYRELVKRAAQSEPVAYLTGTAPFFNLEFQVTRDVLIPRPDTETLVEAVLQLSRNTAGLESPRVLDLCTGSACVAAAIAYHHKNSTLTATELSPAAAAVARRNIERLGLSERVWVEEGDLFEPLARVVDQRPYDILVANPPYIPTGQIASLDPSVRDYEPHAALDGGLDGLAIHRRILRGAPERVSPGGHVLLEIAFDQAAAALAMAADFPTLTAPRIIKDHAGHDRVLSLRRA